MYDDNLKAKIDEEFYMLIGMILLVIRNLSIIVEILYRYVLKFVRLWVGLLLSPFLKLLVLVVGGGEAVPELWSA